MYLHFIQFLHGRRPEVELLALDTELERTLINMKKMRKVEKTLMVEQEETNQNVLVVGPDRPQRQRTMKDF